MTVLEVRDALTALMERDEFAANKPVYLIPDGKEGRPGEAIELLKVPDDTDECHECYLEGNTESV